MKVDKWCGGLLSPKVKDNIKEVRRFLDRLILIKVVIEEVVMNVCVLVWKRWKTKVSGSSWMIWLKNPRGPMISLG